MSTRANCSRQPTWPPSMRTLLSPPIGIVGIATRTLNAGPRVQVILRAGLDLNSPRRGAR